MSSGKVRVHSAPYQDRNRRQPPFTFNKCIAYAHTMPPTGSPPSTTSLSFADSPSLDDMTPPPPPPLSSGRAPTPPSPSLANRSSMAISSILSSSQPGRDRYDRERDPRDERIVRIPTAAEHDRLDSPKRRRLASPPLSDHSSLSPPTAFSPLNGDAHIAYSPSPSTPIPPTTSPITVPSSAVPPNAARRKQWKAPTGHRRGITINEMLPLEAPTQPRRSSISRQNVQIVTTTTNSRSPASSMSPEAEGIQQQQQQQLSPASSSSSITAIMTPTTMNSQVSPTLSQLNDSGTNGTTTPTNGEQQVPMEQLDPIALKRRQNTVAARRSRQRKLEHVRLLEAEVVALRGERDALKERCGVLEERVGFLRGMVVGGQQQQQKGGGGGGGGLGNGEL